VDNNQEEGGRPYSGERCLLQGLFLGFRRVWKMHLALSC
jgi:hypothetical protein